MKAFVFALFALSVFGSSTVTAKAGNEISDTVLSILDRIKAVLPPEIEVQDKVLELDSDILSGTITLNELSVTGLDSISYGIDVGEGDATDNYEFSLVFDEVKVSIDLGLDLTGLINAHDPKLITIDINDIKVVSHTVGANDHLEILDYTILLTIGDTIVNVEGLGNEELSKQVSQELTENVSEIFDQITTAISEPVSNIIEFVVNTIFKLAARNSA